MTQKKRKNSRAQRRADRERLAKQRRYVGKWDRVDFDLRNKEHHTQIKKIGEVPPNHRAIDTKTPCSCSMCGNPRRKLGEITLTEIKANQDFEQQKKELE